MIISQLHFYTVLYARTILNGQLERMWKQMAMTDIKVLSRLWSYSSIFVIGLLEGVF
jgi:hypothetical protein